jgi:GTP diphosphokinase / guanosine-3',5'-bis(diphosphate) 3'-diphosphatase
MPKKLTAEELAFEELVTLVKKTRTDLSVSRIQRAYDFARKAHEGQFRMSGDPYVCHPIETAKILVGIQAAEDVVIAGLLHDVPEDTDMTVRDVEKRFGKHVAKIVSALTKLSKVYYRHSMGERQVQSLRKMFVETANDVDVVVVKLADRLHNMKTLQYLRPDKQQRIASETLEIYAPLANLYGIYQLRRQLEDLCFMYLQPEEYARIDSFIYDNEKKRQHFVADTIEVLKKTLRKEGIEVELQGRPKHYYSIYQKMIRDKKVLQDIFDYFAIRMIVKDIPTCYHALGMIHKTFKPKPKRVKDYIALAKPNGYQSLHTTVIGLRGKLTEVQIRTEDMHLEAEFGAAAHSLYKDGGTSYLSESISQLKNYKNPESFIRGLQDDVLQERIYVFSPTGEIINLPAGATCLDYVFAVDLAVNKRQFRAIVNNKNYSLIGELQSGDHVEIVYGNKELKGPERWWLGHVKTNTAKEKIQEHFSRKSLTDKVAIGEKLLQQELDHEHKGLIYHVPISRIGEATRRFRVDSFEEILAKIGGGTLSANEVYAALFPRLEVGFVVKVWKAIKWGLGKVRILNQVDNDEEKYRISVQIDAFDRMNLLQELLQPFYDLHIQILKNRGWVFRTRKPVRTDFGGPIGPYDPTRISRDVVDIYIDDQEQLIALFDRLEKLPGVIQVQRTFRRRQVAFFVLLTMTTAYVILHPFLLQYMLQYDLSFGHFWFSVVIYLGLFGILGMMAWLRSMGNKTFPHFEETRFFWPLSFGLAILGIVTIFVDDAVFDLELQTPIMIGFSLLILLYLYGSFKAHEKRRTRHLTRLKESRQVKLDE